MAGASMDVKVECNELLRRLADAAARGANMRPAWDSIGELALNSVKENFQQGGRPSKWKGISSKGLIAKFGGKGKVFTAKGGIKKGAAKKVVGNKLLIDTGNLINSIHRLTGSTGTEISTNVEYAAAHNYGYEKGHIPQRQFMLLQDSDYRDINEFLTDFLMRSFR